MPTPQDRQAFSVRMPTEQYDALKTYSFFTKTPMNEVIVKAVASFLSDAGRAELIDTATAAARDQYRGALDRLKEL